jgi:tRNA uridine 5-carboxymethylaminomethyl modification enzyme
MMTSRAEFRLLLREDNTAERLLPIGRRLGLVDDARWARFEAARAGLAAARERAERASVTGTDAVNQALVRRGSTPLAGRRATLAELLRRPELDWAAVEEIAAAGGIAPAGDAAALERTEIEIKYEGYLRRQRADAERVAAADDVRLPDDLDYAGIPGLSREVIEKLEAQRPRSLGHAARISGVTPVAVSILMTHLALTRRRRADVSSSPP